MENIKREITTDYIINLLNVYIDMQNKINLTENEKNGILKFIMYQMGEGFDEGTD